jgi:hypothetical protein
VGYSIVPTFDNCYYVVGNYSSVTTDADAWVLKINSSGDTLWTCTYGGYGFDYGIDILPTESDSGYIITGETALPSAPSDLFVLKCNANGDSMWIRTYGGNSPDGPESMIKMYDGGFAICGHTGSYGAGSYDVWVLRMSGETGVQEQHAPYTLMDNLPTIWHGPLLLPRDHAYRIFDINGREITCVNPPPGVYFIQLEKQRMHKVIIIR